jgi:hypothetical protein
MKLDLDKAASLYSQQYEARSVSDDLSNPYVGPRPFEIEHKKLFFGRDREADMLLSLTIAERVVLFHAQSGAGKSSLVNAKLIPGLEEQDYLVLPRARVGVGDGAQQKDVANVFIFNALGSIVPGKIESEALAQAQLSQYRAWLLPEQQDKPRWLIFDQFEEILTTNLDFWHQRKDFFKQVAAALSQDSLLSVMFVMRSDYGAGIEPYASLLPGNLRTRYYMELPKRAAALEAVQKPVLEFGYVFETNAAEELVNRLSLINTADGEKEGEHVEPVLLQVVCQQLWNKQLWNKIIPKGTQTSTNITLADVTEHAQVDAALRNFYEDAVKAVAQGQPNGEEKIRNWFGECLIVPPGIRGQVMRGKEMSGDLETTRADQFVEKHIIRREETRGAVWYELAHDRLIRPIRESNDAWLNQGENVYQRLALKWHQSDYADELLLAAHEQQAAQLWLEQNHKIASQRVQEFINNSLDKENQRQKDQKLLEVRHANETLEKQKLDLEAQHQTFVKAKTDEIAELETKQREILKIAVDEKLRIETEARKFRRVSLLVVLIITLAATVLLVWGGAMYQKRKNDATNARQVAEESQRQAKLQEEAAEKQKALAIRIFNRKFDSDSDQKMQEIEKPLGPAEQPTYKIPVGLPPRNNESAFIRFALETPFIELKTLNELNKTPKSGVLTDTNPTPKIDSDPPKIVFWNRDTKCGDNNADCAWQAKYVAYTLIRAGIQVRVIRECGNDEKEISNVTRPLQQRDFNLCRWNPEWNESGAAVVVGWNILMPFKENCTLTAQQVDDKEAWRFCLDQARNPAAISVRPTSPKER